MPKLYGKIEPLLGMQPRTAQYSAVSGISRKALVVLRRRLCAAPSCAELAATAGMSLIDWEADWAESGTAMAVGMVALLPRVAIVCHAAHLKKSAVEERLRKHDERG